MRICIRLRGILIAVLVAHLLSACGVAKRWGDINANFSPDSKTAMVIGGVHTDAFFAYRMRFRQYDPNTQRLVPDGGSFILSHSVVHESAKAHEVPAGYYAVTRSSRDVAAFGGSIGTWYVPEDQISRKWLVEAAPDADISSSLTYRIRLYPGEAAFFGEFVVGPYKPKWENRRDELENILKKMPNLEVEPKFRPPTLTSRLAVR